MNYNYHTHTVRCHHASGSSEEYVKKAIENGIKYMGFSDHIPFVCDDGKEFDYRVPFGEGRDYVKEICSLREKYKNEIEIGVGFESEYYPSYFDGMLKSAIDFGAEYLILGQHYSNGDIKGKHNSIKTEDEQKLKEYVDTVCEGIRSGYFTYVAHPDVINFVGDRELYKKEMRKICVASREYNVPLEINFLGIREGRNYPDPVFWQMVGEEKSPVTFGFDAHDIDAAYDGASLKKAKQMVKDFGLNYIGKPETIWVQEQQTKLAK
ncbi:MAG: histidinol-phosphatase [Oscillospiraceae bacterium]|nr:histidinol-phosphatase [Oscillospiraceae bacterium]